MPATGIPFVDLAQTGLGVAQSIVGLINSGKAKREAERLAESRPDYEISPLVDQDLSLTQSELANGMSNAAERAYNNLNNGQFSSSLSGLLRSGGNVNSIGELYGNSEDGRLRLAQIQDQLRLRQIDNYLRASERKQQEQQTQWQINEFAPWQDEAQANAEARRNAQGQIYGGINATMVGLSNIDQSIRERKKLDVPIIMNPNNPNSNSRGLLLPDAVSNYIPSNYNFNANSVTPMQTPIFNP